MLAQDEAKSFKHTYIGTEHLLVGILREEEGLGARTLVSFGITAGEVQDFIRRVVGEGDQAVNGQIPFTPRAKKVLELALREALSLGHNYIGTEHVTMGLVRESDGLAARFLAEKGVTVEAVRNEITSKLSDATPVQELRTALNIIRQGLTKFESALSKIEKK